MKKLAKIIHDAGKEISKDPVNKDYHVEYKLQKTHATDNNPCVLIVTDDSGYRSIILGDMRGNVSLDSGKLDLNLNHKGYVYLYRDSKENGKWKYPCFPPTTAIEKMLHKIANKMDSPSLTCYSGDSGINATKEFLASCVKRFQNLAEQ